MQMRTREILPAGEEQPRDAAARRVSVVIPCLDEAETIGECVTRARTALAANGLAGEVIVVDNGSADGSGELPRRPGAPRVARPRPGGASPHLAGPPRCPAGCFCYGLAPSGCQFS